MCGIAGKLDFDGPVDEALLHRMCRVIEHRGPDSRGIHTEPGVGLGIQRLAIIDVAGGDQPIYNEDGGVAVVMNGEIYNHAELREELIQRGHRFRAKVDTEVLAHLYEEHGAEMVGHLRGMFAFAIWDRRRRCLLLARDRVGKKPLFWARRGSRFWFGSEVRSLLQDPELERVVNPHAIDAYLTYQYVPHPICAFDGLSKLPPASTLMVSERGEEESTYWSLEYTPKFDDVPLEELEQRLRDELWEATKVRLESEVPLGAFLSGGLDSSAVVAAMADQSAGQVKTFSIGFPDEQFDEVGYARIVAEQFGTDHHEFQVEPKDLSILTKLAAHYGEPFADSSAIPSFFLAELTSKHVTVALNGDGGDESFAGYTAKYVANEMVARRFGWMPAPLRSASGALGRAIGSGSHRQTLRSRLGRRARLVGLTVPQRYARWMSTFDVDERHRVLAPEFQDQIAGDEDVVLATWRQGKAADRVDRMLEVDVQTYLPGDLLAKMDIATMAYSVEARSPFLDHHLMEFAAALPAELKLKGSATKRLLKSALRGRLPDEIIDRPKMGFSVPLGRWFREDLRDMPGEVLLDPRALERGYFIPGQVERIINEHQEGLVDHWPRIWTMLQLEMWHREVLEAPIASAEPLG